MDYIQTARLGSVKMRFSGILFYFRNDLLQGQQNVPHGSVVWNLHRNSSLVSTTFFFVQPPHSTESSQNQNDHNRTTDLNARRGLCSFCGKVSIFKYTPNRTTIIIYFFFNEKNGTSHGVKHWKFKSEFFEGVSFCLNGSFTQRGRHILLWNHCHTFYWKSNLLMAYRRFHWGPPAVWCSC